MHPLSHQIRNDLSHHESMLIKELHDVVHSDLLPHEERITQIKQLSTALMIIRKAIDELTDS